MRRIVIGVVALVAAAFACPAPAYATTPTTRANLSTAMTDEATAYADYLAWAAHAAKAGNTGLAYLLTVTADMERNEHFAELADAASLVGNVQGNVVSSMIAEATEANTTYPGFASQALADGDPVTAALFTELAGDEGTHQALLARAYRFICRIGTVPVAPAVDPETIVEGPAQATGQTLVNVRTAMRGEATASAKYRLFATAAYVSGRAWLGRLFTGLSDIELREHYAALANRYGLVGTDTANLAAAIAAENGAIAAYTGWSAEATAAGDGDVAALFTDIRGDEVVHRDAFMALSGG